MCSAFRGSSLKDNLSILNKIAGPNVSFIQQVKGQPLYSGLHIKDQFQRSQRVHYREITFYAHTTDG